MPVITKKRVMYIWPSPADGSFGTRPTGTANGALELGQHAGLRAGGGIQGLELDTTPLISSEESESNVYTGTKRRTWSVTIREEEPTATRAGTQWLLDLEGVTGALLSVEHGPQGNATGKSKLEYQIVVNAVNDATEGELSVMTIEARVNGAPTRSKY